MTTRNQICIPHDLTEEGVKERLDLIQLLLTLTEDELSQVLAKFESEIRRQASPITTEVRRE